jgi:hypothetical protein
VDSAIEAVLRRYEERAAAETKRTQELPPAEFTKHIDEFLLAVGPATGQLMNLLIKEAKARTILELGTSHGYSTVWLAEAARATGGKVISMDVHPGKHFPQGRRGLPQACPREDGPPIGVATGWEWARSQSLHARPRVQMIARTPLAMSAGASSRLWIR